MKDPSQSKEHRSNASVQMSRSYFCKDNICDTRGRSHLEDHGEAIEHLRSYHRQSFIKRPNKVGIPDNHGNYWYCMKCSVNKTGKDHRSFRSDRAMWDHLCDCHDGCMDNIRPADSVMTTAAMWTPSTVQIHNVSLTNANVTTVVSEWQILPDHRAQTTYSSLPNRARTEGEWDYGNMLFSNGNAERRAEDVKVLVERS